MHKKKTQLTYMLIQLHSSLEILPSIYDQLNVPFDHQISLKKTSCITIYDQLNVPFHTQAL